MSAAAVRGAELVIVMCEPAGCADEAELLREVELAYEYADESLGRPAGV
jgi:hypothetical protein